MRRQTYEVKCDNRLIRATGVYVMPNTMLVGKWLQGKKNYAGERKMKKYEGKRKKDKNASKTG